MNSHDLKDIQFMKRALFLAKKGIGTVSPNPLVGAVVVKDNIILGEGYHIRSGEGHAEVNAIKNCGDVNIEGATIYVTLEPCCHTNKKTPPCTSLLIDKKIKRVVVASLDPNPHVAGNGIELLKNAGMDVAVGVLNKEAIELNEIFFKYITLKKPFINIKFAQTIDGKMATLSGDSKWITDESARTIVHEMRLRFDAVMVGRQTLNNDNPSLDIRMGVDNKGKIPYRVIVGRLEELKLDSKILTDEYTSKTIIITPKKSVMNITSSLETFFRERLIKIIEIDYDAGETLEVGIDQLLNFGITSVLVEGGPRLINEMIIKNLYDKITVFIAPKLIGNGPSYFESSKIQMSEAINFSNVKVKTIGNQVCYELGK